MQIHILEDDGRQSAFMLDVVRTALINNKLNDATVHTYREPRELLSQLNRLEDIDLFFLDIELGGQNERGFEVAKEIRQRMPHAQIVFVTAYTEFLPLTFQYMVSALKFIDKGLDNRTFYKEVEACLLYVETMREQNADWFLVSTKRTEIKVPFSEVLFIETSDTPHQLVLHMREKSIAFYGNLKDIALIDKRLFHCYKSAVVNIQAISRIDKSQRLAYFTDSDMSCPLARNKVTKVVQLLNQYQEGRL
ncbi:LytR/AlgR family response regulator transcription factor [Streptococcus sp. DD12]|uniref:LytR/AlgR family response regulator transcription factor n=1 Tax=Streptococcus sp. DD12 TaxID=1777880 RepID=UPI0007958279|nr:response regulator transcription factor [Streptococcus sp. DD12]KXT75490.1 Response regulator FasA or ComE or BlpR [Streptococcus sp. DD12]